MEWSIHYRIATGPHTGRNALTVRTVAPDPLADAGVPLAAVLHRRSAGYFAYP